MHNMEKLAFDIPIFIWKVMTSCWYYYVILYERIFFLDDFSIVCFSYVKVDFKSNHFLKQFTSLYSWKKKWHNVRFSILVWIFSYMVLLHAYYMHVHIEIISLWQNNIHCDVSMLWQIGHVYSLWQYSEPKCIRKRNHTIIFI